MKSSCVKQKSLFGTPYDSSTGSSVAVALICGYSIFGNSSFSSFSTIASITEGSAWGSIPIADLINIFALIPLVLDLSPFSDDIMPSVLETRAML